MCEGLIHILVHFLAAGVKRIVGPAVQVRPERVNVPRLGIAVLPHQPSHPLHILRLHVLRVSEENWGGGGGGLSHRVGAKGREGVTA